MEEFKPRKEVIEWVKSATNMHSTSIIRHIEQGTEKGKRFYEMAERRYDNLQKKLKEQYK